MLKFGENEPDKVEKICTAALFVSSPGHPASIIDRDVLACDK
jgi:hypothetical protein